MDENRLRADIDHALREIASMRAEIAQLRLEVAQARQAHTYRLVGSMVDETKFERPLRVRGEPWCENNE